MPAPSNSSANPATFSNCAPSATFSVTFSAASSLSPIPPLPFKSPNVGKFAKSTPAPPRSMLMPLTVAALPSMSPTTLTASTPNFCKSFRLVDRCVLPAMPTSKLISSLSAKCKPASINCAACTSLSVTFPPSAPPKSIVVTSKPPARIASNCSPKLTVPSSLSKSLNSAL